MTATSHLLKLLATLLAGAALQSCIAPNAVLNFGALPISVPSPNSSNTTGSSDHLAFLVQPTNIIANSVMTPAVQVEFLTQNNTLDTSNNAVVTLTIGNYATAGALLSGTLTVSASGGIAIFSGLSINLAGSGYTLNAQSASLPVATSSAFNVTSGTAGVPSKLAFTTQPGNGTSGQTGSITITIEDFS